MYANGNICNATGKLPQKQFVITGKISNKSGSSRRQAKRLPVSPPSRQ
jgi:hypothetical protein